MMNPLDVTDMRNVESVQLRVTKIGLDLQYKPISRKASGIEYRREDMIQANEILQKVGRMDASKVFTHAQYKATRSH